MQNKEENSQTSSDEYYASQAKRGRRRLMPVKIRLDATDPALQGIRLKSASSSIREEREKIKLEKQTQKAKELARARARRDIASMERAALQSNARYQRYMEKAERINKKMEEQMNVYWIFKLQQD
jgi:hypothetical protein